MVKHLSGTAWCVGDDVNTDLIYPGRYLTITKPSEMAKVAFMGLEQNFTKKVKHGDMIIGGNNIGNGSSREQAAMCLKYAGMSAVIAVSFARIFFRNLINQGLPALVSHDAIRIIHSSDKIELNMPEGRIKNLTTGDVCSFEVLPAFLMEIIDDGGIIPHLKKKMK